MPDTFEMIAKTFFGLEQVLAEELAGMGAQQVRSGRRMCSFQGDRALLYRANIRCRTAVRVLKPIHWFTITDEPSLYRGVQQVDWCEHLAPDGTLAIDPVVHHSIFANSLYAAQLAKDAIVDQIRERSQRRPSVDLADPDLRLNLHIAGERATLYLDASGESLHKRGYRAETGEAPLNEVLAAGILRLAKWDAQSALADFMCGSGTILIEAALMGRSIAPGTLGRHFAYERWPDFCARTHAAELAAARAETRDSLAFPVQGSDLDASAIAAARANAARAGVDRDITWSVANFVDARPPAAAGMLVSNPPYDQRMKAAHIEIVYRRLGDALKHNWHGHSAFLLIGHPLAAKSIGLRTSQRIRLFNGPIECRLLKYELFASEKPTPPKSRDADTALNDFANRLTRMGRHWARSFARRNTEAYRVYDRDMPDVPLAIDRFGDRVLITPYERPHGRTEIEQQAWLDKLAQATADALGVPASHVRLRVRESGTRAKRASRKLARVVVHEGPLAFEVRVDGEGEAGLALERRGLRGELFQRVAGARALSLFARAGTSMIAMAAGGAVSSVSVEESGEWTAWAQRNWRLNEMNDRSHKWTCDDPRLWIKRAAADGPQFDLAVVEPPGFDGQRRPGVWNVQDGHVELLRDVLATLTPDGKIYFATSFRRLHLHSEELEGASTREITRRIAQADIRDKRAVRGWVIERG
ncbi:MAG TPA: bifunctional 23S rRNA (guanine(2069)-N(7))-methyltransferase RlmK/23S rRNA (guanine(2445)-N(2))-methyltransferase RlmL [Pirellulales bacterium]|jgi:23S rRNA G2445 N2-methylase RlmL/23S rRNA G2069 N7-methylase RlmK/C1962 C5-methylase RlmI|nr:bifunctional 23S rRNA (guanine(2069)-N(7))-methyltransferase RlmK/23S rRNA (guanine(2445)-N(2))-methyltransferase RlmL [Pirellulales bacterium]